MPFWETQSVIKHAEYLIPSTNYGQILRIKLIGKELGEGNVEKLFFAGKVRRIIRGKASTVSG